MDDWKRLMSTDDLWKMWQGSWSVYQLVNTVTKLGFNIKYHQCHSIISKMAPHANNGTCPWSHKSKKKNTGTCISKSNPFAFKSKKSSQTERNKMPVFIECLHQIVFVKYRIKHKNIMTFLFIVTLIHVLRCWRYLFVAYKCT